jgi:hypothetical protein
MKIPESNVEKYFEKQFENKLESSEMRIKDIPEVIEEKILAASKMSGISETTFNISNYKGFVCVCVHITLQDDDGNEKKYNIYKSSVQELEEVSNEKYNQLYYKPHKLMEKYSKRAIDAFQLLHSEVTKKVKSLKKCNNTNKPKYYVQKQEIDYTSIFN